MQRESAMARTPSRDELEKSLAAAAAAHHDYEQRVLNGVRDAQWPGFYAAYVLGRVGDFTTPSSLSRWLEAAPAGDNWAASAADYVLRQTGA